MLQALNILENADLKAMGYNSPRYIHALYQAMNLAYADRDFYYGDPYFPPAEPVKGILSKEYAKARYGEINWTRNDSTVKPGDPYPYQGGTNPFTGLLAQWNNVAPTDSAASTTQSLRDSSTPAESLREASATTESLRGAHARKQSGRLPTQSLRGAYAPKQSSRSLALDSAFRRHFY